MTPTLSPIWVNMSTTFYGWLMMLIKRGVCFGFWSQLVANAHLYFDVIQYCLCSVQIGIQ